MNGTDIPFPDLPAQLTRHDLAIARGWREITPGESTGDKGARHVSAKGLGRLGNNSPNTGIEVLPIPRPSWPGLTRPPRCRCGERGEFRWVPGSSPGMTSRGGGAWGHPHPPQERSPLPARGRETQEPRAPSPMAFQSAPSLPLAGRGNRRQAVGGGAPCAGGRGRSLHIRASGFPTPARPSPGRRSRAPGPWSARPGCRRRWDRRSPCRRSGRACCRRP